MKIKSAEFTICAVSPGDFPSDGLPEIALIGKSNVGKSSLINSFINRKGLAKTSSTPGKTRTINFYRINKAFYLVDLPGYGYAKVPLSERRSWKSMIDGYFTERAPLAGALIILDSRREPGESEHELYSWLDEIALPFVTVITKADKFSKSKAVRRAGQIRKELAISTDDAFLFSATSGLGKSHLGNVVSALLGGGDLRDG